MKKMTEANLQAAFAGESQAHLKYLNFAERAQKDGLVNVARLFQAAAYAEYVHASNHLRALGGIQDTAANLAGAFDGETFEIDEMYPAYRAVAEAQAEKGALRSMTWALAAEKIHAQLYSAARQAVAGQQDIAGGAMWVCETCGFTGEGEAPDVCPLCGARHEKLRPF